MAFRVAVSGIQAATKDLNATGNNIANSNTTGFKRARVEFADIFANSNLGSAQDASGQGVQVTRVAQQFSQGNISFTDNNLDLAVNGEGFFVVEDNNGIFYTRAGAFGVDRDGNVVNGTGQRLQAFQAAANGSITGAVGDLQIDTSNIAPEATTAVEARVNLDAGDDTNVHPSLTFTSFSDFQNEDGYTFDLTDGAGNTETVELDFLSEGPDPTTASRTEVAEYISSKVNQTTHFDAEVNGSNVVLTAARRSANKIDVTNLVNAPAATTPPPPPSLTVDTGSGVGIDPADDLDLNFGAGDDLTTTFTDPFPFNPNEPRSFNNATSLTVFDSLGQEHLLSTYYRKVEANLWEVHARIDGDNTQLVGGGTPPTISFDSGGNLTTATPMPINFGQFTPTTGAAPIDVSIDFTGTTQFGAAFGVNALSQDGFSTGRLSGVDISDDGLVQARFSNGKSRALGQVQLANFANVQGLQPQGDTLWAETANSGEPLPGAPGTASLGLVQAGALEESNVELADQLVNMIVAQRNFQANAQMIRTEDEVTQTIINIR
ncbi:MAG: flagellar hook protein FlgE [Gammaproteobacteria bacterium]|nr:flagellar hook protein FlgE [Gammaproteobacteria bacterium]